MWGFLPLPLLELIHHKVFFKISSPSSLPSMLVTTQKTACYVLWFILYSEIFILWVTPGLAPPCCMTSIYYSEADWSSWSLKSHGECVLEALGSQDMLQRDLLGQSSHSCEQQRCAVHATALGYSLTLLNFLHPSCSWPWGAEAVAGSVFWSWRNVSPMLSLQMPRHASLHQGHKRHTGWQNSGAVWGRPSGHRDWN